MNKVTDIKDRTPNQALIDSLKTMLEHAESGELRTMVSVYGWDDDGWTHGWCLDKRNTRRRLLGELSMLQYDMLTNVSFEDGNTVLSQAFED